MSIEKHGAAICQRVQVRSLRQRVAAQRADPIVLIVDGDEQHVRLPRRLDRRSENQQHRDSGEPDETGPAETDTAATFSPHAAMGGNAATEWRRGVHHHIYEANAGMREGQCALRRLRIAERGALAGPILARRGPFDSLKPAVRVRRFPCLRNLLIDALAKIERDKFVFIPARFR